MKINKYICNLYSVLVVLFPILSRYQSPFPTITFSEFILFFFFFMFFFFLSNKLYYVYQLCPILLMLLFSLIIKYMYDDYNFYPTFWKTCRLFFIYFAVIIFTKNLFKYDFGKKILIIFSIFVSGYTFLQFSLHMIGYNLSANIPFLKLMTDEPFYLSGNDFSRVFRPRGLLNEPAHLCTYLVLPLYFILFDKKSFKFSHFIAIFISLACVISLSTTGIAVVFFLWFLYLINTKMSKPKILLILVLIFLVVLFANLGLFDFVVNRSFKATSSNFDLSFISRLSCLHLIDWDLNNIYYLVFGHGLGSGNYYLPSFLKLFYDFGILGIICFTISFIWLLINKDPLTRKGILLLLFINIGTEMLFGEFALFYFTFITCNHLDSYNKNLLHIT